MNTTLHILSCPYDPVHITNRTNPFSIAVIKFIDNMTKLGWNCIHYGIVGSEVNCENIICVDKIDSDNAKNVETYNNKAKHEIAARKKPDDLILCFYGIENRVAAEFNRDLKAIEPGIGYATSAVFADYRVFTSYAQMHYYYGENGKLMSPSWTDEVIYNSISPYEFEYNENKEDYLLYFGRVTEYKGVNLAIQVAKETGHRLVIAGPGHISHLGYSEVPSHVDIAGVCDTEKRKQLMKNAKALLGPTYYIEPFGNMVAEAYMSGTPAITTDWGAFTETVVQGVTGFRCREFKEFVSAVENIHTIDHKNCLLWAMNNCAEEVVHKKYDQYFKKIMESNFYRK